MDNIDNRKRRKYKETITSVAHFLEIVLAGVILIAVTLGIMDTIIFLINEYIINFSSHVDYEKTNGILAQLLLLVIGVEIAVMLTLHIQTALFEVLLYGIARKMLLVPKGNGMLEILLGVLAIGGLYFIKKYLSITEDPEDESLANNCFKGSIIKKPSPLDKLNKKPHHFDKRAKRASSEKMKFKK